jgi:hypothetical protein
MEALRFLYEAAIATSVSIEPNLEPDCVGRLVQIVGAFTSGEIWVGKCNKLRERTKWAFADPDGIERYDRPWLGDHLCELEAWQTDEKVMEVVRGLQAGPFAEKIRWKDSYRDVIDRQRPAETPR